MRHLTVLFCLFLWGGAAAQTTATPQSTNPSPTAGATHVRAGGMPVEFFTKFDEFGGVKISPDGAFIAALSGKYGRSRVVFIDLKEKRTVSAVRVQDDCEIDEYYWVSPTRLIYTIAQRQRENVRPTPTGEIFAVNRDGTQMRMLYGYRAEERTLDTRLAKRKASYATPVFLSSLKQDPQRILIAEYPWRNLGNVWVYDPDTKPLISRLDVFTGRKQKIDAAPLRGARLLLDHDDNVRFAIGRDAHSDLAISWKPQPGSKWTSFRLEGFAEDTIAPRRFSADNGSVYLTGMREDDTYDTLYRLDLQTQKVEKVYAFASGDVADVIADFAGRELIGVMGYTDRQIDVFLDEDDPAAQTYEALQRAFPDQRVNVTSTSADGRLAVVYVDSDVNPGDYYLFDTVAKKADFLRGGRIWIEPRQMRPKEPFTFKARDGLELQGYVTRPTGDNPYPMIVLPHGGPHGVRDTWEYDPEVQLLASRGYAVLQVNYRGSGGFGIDFETSGYGEWGAKMQDDITDATRWAIEQKIAIADRICIYGGSYGGYAALMGAAREPDLYRCAIGYAGVYDLPLMFGSGDVPDSRFGRDYLERVLGNDMNKLRARSPVSMAQDIKAQVLLIHGKDDTRADYEHAKRMRAALEQHRKKVEWLALGGEGHGVYDEDSRREVYERILQFLDSSLRSSQPVASQ
jgi:dipeptidyl aminopeptidase/acylaminoacyl peptidase